MSVDPDSTPQETPEGSAPEQGTPLPQHDWEQRYKDTHTWGQQAHDVLSNEDKLLGYIEKNHPGLLYEEPDEQIAAIQQQAEPQTPAVDPDIAELKQFKTQLEEQQHAEQVRAVWDGFSGYMADEAQKNGVELSEWELDALRFRCNTDGLPAPPQEADKVLKDFLTARTDQEAQPRRRRPAAPNSGGSAPADKAPEEKSEQERVASMVARLQAGET